MFAFAGGACGDPAHQGAVLAEMSVGTGALLLNKVQTISGSTL